MTRRRRPKGPHQKSKPKPEATKPNPKPKPKARPLSGTRKHLQDWVQAHGFREDLNRMLGRNGVQVDEDARWMPGPGHELQARLDQENARKLLPADRGEELSRELATWWLADPAKGNTPNWDLVVSCRIDDQPGLLLIEGKSHEREISLQGKRLDPKAGGAAAENHEHIRQALAEARKDLQPAARGLSLSLETHYSLATRVAFAWKLASLGVPVVLVYLGFIGDQQKWPEDYLRDRDHWTRIMGGYLQGVLPQSFPEQRISCGASHFELLIKTRDV